MKDRFKFLMVSILSFFSLLAVMSVFMTLIFRDVRTGPMGQYLTGYLWPRFMEFFMIFAPTALVLSGLALVAWLIYEVSREEKA